MCDKILNENYSEIISKVDYSDLIDLGFEKMEIEDYVHMTQYGYPYFILTYGNENDIISMEWSPVDREVNLYLNSRTYRRGISLEEVSQIINMLKSNI